MVNNNPLVGHSYRFLSSMSSYKYYNLQNTLPQRVRNVVSSKMAVR